MKTKPSAFRCRMVSGASVAFLALALCAFPAIERAATLHVPADYATIEAALAVAQSNDTVRLAQGTYVLSSAAGISVTNFVRLVGAGPDSTTISAMPNGTSESKLLKLVNGWVEGATFANACMTVQGTANAMVHSTGASVITNCVFSEFTMPSARGNKGCAIYLAGKTEMSDSVVRNIRTSNSTAYDPLIPIYLGESAHIHDCAITNNQFRYRDGGAVTIAGANAALRRTLVKGNTHLRVEANGTRFAGGVVLSAAGTLEDCVIDGNSVKGLSSYANTVHAGGICIAAANAKVRRCIVRNNTASTTAAAAGVYAYKGSTTPYQDLLIVGNAGTTGVAGGLHAADASAKFVNCTVFGNMLSSNVNGTPGAYMAKGSIQDSIIYGNGTGEARFTTNNVIKSSTATVNYCCVTCPYEASFGTGNIAAAPLFINPENGDFHLSLLSPCRDSGTTIAGAGTTDIAGTERPQGSGVDMGCYEFAASANPECSIAVNAAEIPAGGTATFTAAAMPTEGVARYEWTISDASGTRTATTDAPSYLYSPSAPCVAEVSLKVVWENNDEATSLAASVRVLPTAVHASLAGGHVWPYETVAKAATNIQAAIDTVYGAAGAPGTVYVHEGVWGADRGSDSTASHLYHLDKAVSLAGVGDVVLDGEGTRRILLLGNPAATATNLAFMRAKSFDVDPVRGAAVELAGGHIADCVISNCTASAKTTDALLLILSGTAERVTVCDNAISSSITVYHQALAPVYMTGGTLRDSHVMRNTFADRAYGGAVCIAGPAVMEDCEVSGNTAMKAEYGYYCTGGVSVRGSGIVRRCRIINNARAASGTIYRCAGGVNTYDGNATVEACIITNNSAGTSNTGCIPAAGVLVGKNACFRNCLIANNRQTDIKATLRTGGVYMEGAGALQNCTIYGNTSTMATNGGIYQVAGTVTNCISYANGGTVAGVWEQHDMRQLGGSAGYSCFGDVVSGAGNICGDPLFRKPAKGNFFVTRFSPCIWKGIPIPGLETDLEGMPRKAAKPTMGCYRFTEQLPTVIIGK